MLSQIAVWSTKSNKIRNNYYPNSSRYILVNIKMKKIMTVTIVIKNLKLKLITMQNKHTNNKKNLHS